MAEYFHFIYIVFLNMNLPFTKEATLSKSLEDLKWGSSNFYDSCRVE